MRRLLPKMSLERLEDRLLLSAGDLDVVFAGGKATANFSLGAAQAQAIAVQSDDPRTALPIFVFFVSFVVACR